MHAEKYWKGTEIELPFLTRNKPEANIYLIKR